MAYARGKYAKAISDRSGMEFPYNEMVTEWNGSFVHVSEYEEKHPQIRRKHVKADAIALANARPMHPDTQKDFVLYVDNGFNNSSMLPASSDNILGTKLTSLEVTSAVGTNFSVVIT
tara:strand:- start:2928 stop:3278 length:351 start_codon:yes stop_codon:yes gene_type:complete